MLDQHLFNLAAREAMQCGVKGLYISATPTENTINFYLKSGCQLTLEPDKVLLALEPEDIHLEYIFDSENNSWIEVNGGLLFKAGFGLKRKIKMDFEAVYADFLNALESIAEQYDELTDTDVRERLREVIEYYFVWNNEVDDRFPQKYAMFSAQADALVASAIRSFIEQAQQLVRDVEVGDERNHLLENFDIETLSGAYFDEFIGSTDQAFEEQPPSSDDYYGNYND